MDRPTKPYNEVKSMLAGASAAWEKLVGHIRFYYEVDENWVEGKPTYKHYNLLFFKRGGKALLTLSLRDGFFLAGITLGAKEREKFEQQRGMFGKAMCDEYDAAEVLHDGKWLGFEVRGDDVLLIDDFIRLVELKRKPNRKVLPDCLEKCACLDIGMSHQEITENLF